MLIGLDVGNKKVGVALSDESETLASPFKTFLRASNQAEQAILELVSTRKISTIIVGLPLSDDGSKNAQCEDVERFCRRLIKRCNATCCFVDEYGTTAEAVDRLGLKGYERRRAAKEKGLLDAASATIILQSFIDQRTREV